MYILEIQVTHLKIQLRTVLKIEFVVKMYGDMSILSQGIQEMEFETSALLVNATDSLLFIGQLFDCLTHGHKCLQTLN